MALKAGSAADNSAKLLVTALGPPACEFRRPAMRAGSLFFAAALCFSLLPAIQLAAAPPSIARLSLRGLQAGVAMPLVVDGTDLTADTRIVADVGLAAQALKPGATAGRLEFELTVDPQAAPGIYLLRLANPQGISSAVAIGVDHLTQAPFAPEIKQLPIALSGSLAGSTVLSTRFSGQQGDPIVVEVESRRLGAALNPTIHLYDARHKQLAWSASRAALGGDARLETILPTTGEYLVELHDALFRGADPGDFRLKIGAFRYADRTFPLGVVRGAATPLEFVSTNLGADRQLVVQIPENGERPTPWPSHPVAISGWRPRLAVSTTPEFVEPADAAAPGSPVVPAAPLAINGRLAAAAEEDRFVLPVKEGDQLRLDVVAHRAGSPVDGVLTVMNEQGGQLATADDRPGTLDPGLDFTVPAGVTKVVVALRDLERRGGPDYVYRIVIRPVAQPDFSVTLAEDRLLVPRDGTVVVRIKADRQNFAGKITVGLEPAPAGLQIAGSEMAPGMTETLLSLTAPGLDPSQLLSRLVARGAREGSEPLEHAVLLGDSAMLKIQPWLREELALAVTPSGVLGIGLADPGQQFPLGGSLPLQITLLRAAGTQGAVRVTLMTTQPLLKKTVKVNNQDQQVDDADRMLRLETPLVIPADQLTAAAKLLVPADLAAGSYDLALHAELLAADNQTAVAGAFTPSVRLIALAPEPKAAETPLAVFEDQPEFIANLNAGNGQATLVADDKFSGGSALKVTPDQKYSEALPGLGVKIRENPGPGEYRYLQFAWRKQGGQSICLQLNHDGTWGPAAGNPAPFRYHAGPGPECYNGSRAVDPALPATFTLVTRDLFADFGAFTLNGLAFSPVDGDFALFDHIYLGRSPADFDRVKP